MKCYLLVLMVVCIINVSFGQKKNTDSLHNYLLNLISSDNNNQVTLNVVHGHMGFSSKWQAKIFKTDSSYTVDFYHSKVLVANDGISPMDTEYVLTKDTTYKISKEELIENLTLENNAAPKRLILLEERSEFRISTNKESKSFNTGKGIDLYILFRYNKIYEVYFKKVRSLIR